MKKPAKKVTTFINPAGFIEQHYTGVQTGPSVTGGVGTLAKYVKKTYPIDNKALILVDITKVSNTDLNSHKAAIKAMQRIPHRRVAIYGPLSLQILLNTLAIVADKYESVHAFNSRHEAIRWLKKEPK